MSLENKTRVSYTAALKLKVIERAKETNNCVAAREFSVSEKLIRDWRKNEAKLQDMPKSKKALRFHATMFDGMEKDLNDWIIQCRQSGYVVTRSSIRKRALQMAKEKYSATEGMAQFTASAGWCTRFMNRYRLCLHQRTKIAQKLPKELDEKVIGTISFQKFHYQAETKNGFALNNVGNMDETPVTFDMPGNQTVTGIESKHPCHAASSTSTTHSWSSEPLTSTSTSSDTTYQLSQSDQYDHVHERFPKEGPIPEKSFAKLEHFTNKDLTQSYVSLQKNLNPEALTSVFPNPVAAAQESTLHEVMPEKQSPVFHENDTRIVTDNIDVPSVQNIQPEPADDGLVTEMVLGTKQEVCDGSGDTNDINIHSGQIVKQEVVDYNAVIEPLLVIEKEHFYDNAVIEPVLRIKQEDFDDSVVTEEICTDPVQSIKQEIVDDIMVTEPVQTIKQDDKVVTEDIDVSSSCVTKRELNDIDTQTDLTMIQLSALEALCISLQMKLNKLTKPTGTTTQ